jgi:hypothetical protein
MARRMKENGKRPAKVKYFNFNILWRLDVGVWNFPGRPFYGRLLHIDELEAKDAVKVNEE